LEFFRIEILGKALLDWTKRDARFDGMTYIRAGPKPCPTFLNRKQYLSALKQFYMLICDGDHQWHHVSHPPPTSSGGTAYEDATEDGYSSSGAELKSLVIAHNDGPKVKKACRRRGAG
jgi:hypothetical protein